MNPHDGEPLPVEDGDRHPFDPHELPDDELSSDELTDVRFERDDTKAPLRSIRTRWVVVSAAAIVVVGMVIGIVVFNASAPDPARGATTAKQAATRFVAAVNAGDDTAAVAISCATFADEARAAARSGSQGISLTLDAVRMDSKTGATALMTEHLSLPGGTKQTAPANVTVLRSSARWLMCGRVS